MVAGVTRADDPVPSDGVNPQREQGFGGLGGQAPPVVVRVEDESDLPLPVLPADQLQPGLADHLPGFTPYDGEREPVTLRAEAGLIALTSEGFPYLRVVTGLPVEIPGHLRAGLVSVEVVEVAGCEQAQRQPGGLNGLIGAEHRPMVADAGGVAPRCAVRGRLSILERDGQGAGRLTSRMADQRRRDG